MDELPWVRVLAASLVDGSLALLCGILLSAVWLRAVGDRAGCRIGTRLSAAALCAGSLLQLVLLAATFGGDVRASALVAVLPDVCGTHAGAVSSALCGAAAVLLAVTWMQEGRAREGLCRTLVVSCLGLHGATGHAASEGTFSLAQGLQWVHLAGMAVWSGGVVVSGFRVLPRLQRERSSDLVRSYLLRLSKVSTWAVIAVALSGFTKSYLATEGSLHLIRSSQWGQILLVKVAVVAVTVLLGGGNRWLLAHAVNWSEVRPTKARWMLRAESICMVVVLMLSAWLANSVPPLD